ncbi:cytochrome P450 [Cyathus striatus]|nr:cytochrome P450 [Cyathus striatus]
MELLLVIFCVSVAICGYIQKRRLPLPPGPRRYPVIGNLLDIPKIFQWEAFMKWGKDYSSDVVFAETIGVKFIILNSVKAADDLLTKRSSIYSCRPRLIMGAELMGWGFQFSVMPYGEKWRERRRLFQKHFPLNLHDNYRPLIKYFARVLEKGLLEEPKSFYERIQHTTGAFALATGYGIKVKPINDPHVEFSKAALGEGLKAGTPGNYLVDVIPALLHLPEWFPGAGFKREAKVWYSLSQEFKNRPFEQGRQELAAGTNLSQSFLSMSLDELSGTKEDESTLEVIKDVASVFYSAGSDTSMAALYVFVLLMTRYPDVQRKAQEEIDEKIGNDRLPEFEDEPNLPYLTAVLLEVLRWEYFSHRIASRVPHFLDKDDIYNGYRMPSGSWVVMNIWAMAHNENDYPDSYTFNPNRYLKNGEIDDTIRDPRSFLFGFGRRICPGSHIAWSTVWYIAVSILANFDILKPLNAHGKNSNQSQV